MSDRPWSWYAWQAFTVAALIALDLMLLGVKP